MRRFIFGLIAVVTLACGINSYTAYAAENDFIVDEELMQEYHQVNWEQQDIEYKKNLNIQLADEIAKELCIPTPVQDEDTHRGMYYVGTNQININENILYSAQYTFKAIVHETRHVWQYQRTQNPITELDNNLKSNLENYTTSESNFEQYLTQSVEKDAEGYADYIYIQLILSAAENCVQIFV